MMLNETTATAMPMMVYENTFVAFKTCEESPLAVRYSNPAYKPIATEVTETNHANQLMRFAIVFTILVVVIGLAHVVNDADDAPVTSITIPMIPGASNNNITPAITYNNALRAAMAFCGICPPTINKNPTTNIMSTAIGGRIVSEKNLITSHTISENDVALVGGLISKGPTAVALEKTAWHVPPTHTGAAGSVHATGHVDPVAQLHASPAAYTAFIGAKRNASAITATKHSAAAFRENMKFCRAVSMFLKAIS